MMTGEMEFNGLFYEEPLQYPAATYILFIAFLPLMTILYMNLLVRYYSYRICRPFYLNIFDCVYVKIANFFLHLVLCGRRPLP